MDRAAYNTDVTYENSASPQARVAIILSLKGLAGANLAPTADAGPNQAVLIGAQVSLDGSASFDGETTVSGYTWTQLSGIPVTLSARPVPGKQARASPGYLGLRPRLSQAGVLQ